MAASQVALTGLIRVVTLGDVAEVLRLLVESPELASAQVERGATRQDAKPHFLELIQHYVYGGDTALHIAAAAYRSEIAQALIDAGADVRTKNRRGAAPLHYAADGSPGAHTWNPGAQAATVRCLIAAGADPNAIDNGGVTPLHRAVRNRCAAAVSELLAGGADPGRPNKRGSTPLKLATQNTGRGGSGSPAAKAQQLEIRRLLELHGAKS